LFVEHLLGNLGVTSTSAVYAQAKAAVAGLVTAKGRLGATVDAVDFLKAQEGSTSAYASIAADFAAKVNKAALFTAANATERDITKLVSAITGVDTDAAAISAAAAAATAAAEAKAAAAATAAATAAAAAAATAAAEAKAAAEKVAADAAAAAKTAADAAAATAAAEAKAAAEKVAADAAAAAKTAADAALAAVDNTTYASEQAALDAANAAAATAAAAAKAEADAAAAKAAADLAAANATITSLQNPAGGSFVLTTNTDVFVGNASNDAFSASVSASESTIASGDIVVDGNAADSDTLTITATSNVTVGATVFGIENVVFNTTSFADLTIDASSVQGAALKVNNLQSGGSTAASVTLDADTAMTVNAGNGVKTLTVIEGDVGKLSTVINAGTATAVNVAASGSASTGEKLNAVVVALSATAINAEGTAATTDAISITAAGSVAINTNSANSATDQVENITLIGSGKALTATINAGDAVEKVTLAGDQSVTVKIGADDINTETVTDSTTAGTTVVDVNAAMTLTTDADTLDLSKVASDSIKLSVNLIGSGSATTGDNVLVASGATVNVAATQGFLISVKGATASANTLNIDTTTVAGASSSASYTLAGTSNADTVNLTVGENTTVTTFTATANVTASGSEDLTLGASAAAKTFNASAMTGDVSATINSGLTSITTGSGDDTLVLDDRNFTLALGDGTDKVQVAADLDLTAETVVFGGVNIIELDYDAASTETASTLTLDASTLVDAGFVIKGNGANKDALVVTMDVANTNLSSLVIDTETMSGVTINGNSGNVASEAQVIVGTNASDTINVGSQNSTASGGAANDSINGGTGNDTLNGDTGNDTIDGGAGNDTLNGGAGDDKLKGNSGNDTINGDAGADDILGDSGTDTLNGGADADKINGGDDKDVIDGGASGDFIVGGAGADTLTGGAGADKFVYATAGVITEGGSTAVTYTLTGTFMAGEVLRITDSTGTAFTASYTVAQGDSLTAIAAGLKAAYNTADTSTDAANTGAVLTITGLAASAGAAVVLTSVAAQSNSAVAVSGTTVSGYDKIVDFTSAEDTIVLGAGALVSSASTPAPTAGVNVKVSANSVVTFAAADDTLAEIIAVLVADSAASGKTLGSEKVVTFELNGNSYVYGTGLIDGSNAAGANDFLIELTGVSGLGTAAIASGVLSFS
jgi:Ca2+-binding RTX toxin-like protein